MFPEAAVWISLNISDQSQAEGTYKTVHGPRLLFEFAQRGVRGRFHLVQEKHQARFLALVDTCDKSGTSKKRMTIWANWEDFCLFSLFFTLPFTSTEIENPQRHSLTCKPTGIYYRRCQLRIKCSRIFFTFLKGKSRFTKQFYSLLWNGHHATVSDPKELDVFTGVFPKDAVENASQSPQSYVAQPWPATIALRFPLSADRQDHPSRTRSHSAFTHLFM